MKSGWMIASKPRKLGFGDLFHSGVRRVGFDRVTDPECKGVSKILTQQILQIMVPIKVITCFVLQDEEPSFQSYVFIKISFQLTEN